MAEPWNLIFSFTDQAGARACPDIPWTQDEPPGPYYSQSHYLPPGVPPPGELSDPVPFSVGGENCANLVQCTTSEAFDIAINCTTSEAISGPVNLNMGYHQPIAHEWAHAPNDGSLEDIPFGEEAPPPSSLPGSILPHPGFTSQDSSANHGIGLQNRLSHTWHSGTPALGSYAHGADQPWSQYQRLDPNAVEDFRFLGRPEILPLQRAPAHLHPDAVGPHERRAYSTNNSSIGSWEKVEVPTESESPSEMNGPSPGPPGFIQAGSSRDSSNSLLSVQQYQCGVFSTPSTSKQPELSLLSDAKPKQQQSTPSTKTKRANAVPGKRAQKSKISRRMGGLTTERKNQAALVRRIGSCIRCRTYKIKCDGNNPCRNCFQVRDSARSFREPCNRSDLKAISLVRHCNGRFDQTQIAFLIYRWINVDSECADMDVAWTLPGGIPIRRAPLSVPYREYIPDNAVDTTTYVWQAGGRVRSIKLPPYAVDDNMLLMEIVGSFLTQSQPEVENWIRKRYKDDPLWCTTYKEIFRYRDKYRSPVLDLALKMQCGAIMSQGRGSVVDPHIHGIQPIDNGQIGQSAYDAYNRDCDRMLPQAMGHQFDVAILRHINNTQTDMLNGLSKKVFQKEPKPWYEIYLTFFVLLANLEFIHTGATSYLKSKRETRFESQVSYVVRSHKKEWEMASQVILHYFRCILRGFLPFRMAREDIHELRTRAGLDEESVEYITKVVRLLDARGVFWLHQDDNGSAEEDASVDGRWIRQLFRSSYAL